MALILGSNYTGSLSTKKDAAGNTVLDSSANKARTSSSSTSPASSSTPTSSSSTTTSTSSTAVNMNDVDSILNGTNLGEDEKSAIRAVYRAIAEGDTQAAAKMVANLELAKAYADPMLARRLALVTDELTRTVEGMDYDLEYEERTLETRLNDLRSDVSFQKNQLGIDLQQELKQLDTYFGEKLNETRDTMAARGMVDSSRRVKKEALLSEQKGDMVETANRQFGVANRNLDVGQERSERDTAREVERLRELTERGKIDLARKGEEAIGTEGMRGLDAFRGIDTLGTSSDPYAGDAQLDYQNQLANFVF